MYELHYLLERRRRGQVTLIPVLYGLPFQDTQDMMAAYKQQAWVGGGRRPERAVLEQWAADVRELLRIATALRADQVWHSPRAWHACCRGSVLFVLVAVAVLLQLACACSFCTTPVLHVLSNADEMPVLGCLRVEVVIQGLQQHRLQNVVRMLLLICGRGGQVIPDCDGTTDHQSTQIAHIGGSGTHVDQAACGAECRDCVAHYRLLCAIPTASTQQGCTPVASKARPPWCRKEAFIHLAVHATTEPNQANVPGCSRFHARVVVRSARPSNGFCCCLQFRGDAGMVEAVVDVVIPYLRAAGRAVVRQPEVQLPAHTVGVEQRREELVADLRQYGMVLLHGMGGIGKTTLANAAYDLLSKTEFAADCCVRMSFHADMRADRILEQQKVALLQLLGTSDAAKKLVRSVIDTQMGRIELAKALRGKKVLLLVDNVWGSQLLDALPSDILSIVADSQSMVLVTSRDAAAAEDFQPAPRVQEMAGLTDADALRLFTTLAFGAGASSPPADRAAIVAEVVPRCGGLPFAVEVTAKQLRDRPIGDWRRWEAQLRQAFQSQKANRPDQEKTLLAALRVSYDHLEPAERQFLLDVAFLVRYCGRSSHLSRETQRNTKAEGDVERAHQDAKAEGDVERAHQDAKVVGFSWDVLRAYCGHELDVLLSRGLVQRVDSGHHLYGHVANLHDSVMALCFGHLLSASLTDTRGRDEHISSTVQVRGSHCFHSPSADCIGLARLLASDDG
jgi:hypothetical protein